MSVQHVSLLYLKKKNEIGKIKRNWSIEKIYRSYWCILLLIEVTNGNEALHHLYTYNERCDLESALGTKISYHTSIIVSES